nr:hypothetical protein [Treponemataceae bacterium]
MKNCRTSTFIKSVFFMVIIGLTLTSCQSFFNKKSSVSIQLPSARNDKISEYIYYFDVTLISSNGEYENTLTAKPGEKIYFSDLPLGNCEITVLGYGYENELLLKGSQECKLVSGANSVNISLSWVESSDDSILYDQLYLVDSSSTTADENHTFDLSCRLTDVTSDTELYYQWSSGETEDEIAFTEITDEVKAALASGDVADYGFGTDNSFSTEVSLGSRLYVACHIISSDCSYDVYSNTVKLEYYEKTSNGSYAYRYDGATEITSTPDNLSSAFDELKSSVYIDEGCTYTDADGNEQSATDSYTLADYESSNELSYEATDIGFGQVPVSFTISDTSATT